MRGNGDTSFGRVLALLILAVFWSAFAALAAGLFVWTIDHENEGGALALSGGLLGLLLIPLVRLLGVMVSAARARDWLTFAAAVGVLIMLCALTLRDVAAR